MLIVFVCVPVVVVADSDVDENIPPEDNLDGPWLSSVNGVFRERWYRRPENRRNDSSSDDEVQIGEASGVLRNSNRTRRQFRSERGRLVTLHSEPRRRGLVVIEERELLVRVRDNREARNYTAEELLEEIRKPSTVPRHWSNPPPQSSSGSPQPSSSAGPSSSPSLIANYEFCPYCS